MPGTTGLRCNSAPPASDTPALKTGEIRVIEARTDVVGSLLRPPELLAARPCLELGEIGPPEFKRIEDAAVDAAIRLQGGAGLAVGTGGGLRRPSLHSQFTQ